MKEHKSPLNIVLFSQPTKNKKEATHITIKAYQDELNTNTDNNVKIVYGKGIIEHLRNFKTEAKKQEVDIIHGFSAAPLLSLKVILAKLLYSRKSKTIYTLKSYSKKWLGSLWFSFLLNFVDFVTVPSKTMAKKLNQRGVLKRKIKVIYSHIDLKKFFNKNKDELKKKYGYQDKKIILYYGSTYYTKGSQILISAAGMVKEHDSEAIIIIAPRDKPTKEYINEANKQSNIKIIEEIDVSDFVNLADVVVLPYLNMQGTEGNPSCLLEAVACKTSIITTFQPEIEELFLPNEEIVMVKPNDPKGLAKKIIWLINNKEIAKEIANRAYNKINKFDIKEVTEEFLYLYRV